MSIGLVDIDRQLQEQSPKQILQYAIDQHEKIGIAFSGAEDVLLVHFALKIKKDISVFCLDTGRLHAQTYRFINKVREHYGIDIEFLCPDTAALQNLISEKGLFSFYKDGHSECCGVRKTEPLRRKLSELDAWITGQRKDQSPGTRSGIPVIQDDALFAAPGKRLTKYNPLANWQSSEVWNHIRALEIPYNELHDQGFVSIGCEPCTRAVGPGQHEREGRWWWEEATQKECGLHASNIDD